MDTYTLESKVSVATAPEEENKGMGATFPNKPKPIDQIDPVYNLRGPN